MVSSWKTFNGNQNNMIKLVRLKNSDKSFYVKMSKSFEFGIPIGHWIGVEDEKIYHNDDLVFLWDILINNLWKKIYYTIII